MKRPWVKEKKYPKRPSLVGAATRVKTMNMLKSLTKAAEHLAQEEERPNTPPKKTAWANRPKHRSAKICWRIVRQALPHIVEYGRKQGMLPRLSQAAIQTTVSLHHPHGHNEEKEIVPAALRAHENTKLDDLIVSDSVSKQAIPFLPVSLGVYCFMCNIILPGTGTIFSGIFGLCFGQPRLITYEGRRVLAFFVNLTVGVSQLVTTSLCLVGWCWSVSWGALLLTYSLEYRNYMRRERTGQAAIQAIEKISNANVLYRSKVQEVVRSAKD